MNIDGTPDLAVQAGVEQTCRVSQRSAFGKSQLHLALVSLAGADDAALRPDRNVLHGRCLALRCNATRASMSSKVSARLGLYNNPRKAVTPALRGRFRIMVSSSWMVTIKWSPASNPRRVRAAMGSVIRPLEVSVVCIRSCSRICEDISGSIFLQDSQPGWPIGLYAVGPRLLASPSQAASISLRACSRFRPD